MGIKTMKSCKWSRNRKLSLETMFMMKNQDPLSLDWGREEEKNRKVCQSRAGV